MDRRQLLQGAAGVAAAMWLHLASPDAHADDAIVVGRTLALSGPLRLYGEAKRDGADALIASVNAAGGINGRRIEVVTLDDAYTPASTVANLRKLAAEQRPTAFLGLFGVPTIAAALPVLQELQIPAVGLTSGTEAVRKPYNRYAFPVRASYADEARKLVSHLKSIGITRTSVIFMDNPFGESLKNALLLAMKGSGIDARSFPLDVAGASAVAVARQATAPEPQAIFIITVAHVAVPVFGALKKSGYRGATYGFSTLDASVITKLLGAEVVGLGLTQVFPIPRGVRLKIVEEYVRATQALGRATPGFQGLEGYIEAKVLVEGLRRAGKNPSPASLVRALESFDDLDLGGYRVSYSPTLHKGSSFVDVNVITASGDIMR
ncbi:MAG TPA: ABC transporter substrate-binding protein [Burkholderiaceae bacterium]|nr:ABC transporter substrate-binding protein [Burkholderiaceae bacterium]